MFQSGLLHGNKVSILFNIIFCQIRCFGTRSESDDTLKTEKVIWIWTVIVIKKMVVKPQEKKINIDIKKRFFSFIAREYSLSLFNAWIILFTWRYIFFYYWETVRKSTKILIAKNLPQNSQKPKQIFIKSKIKKQNKI